ncbi:hypothetical protein M5K25_007020 [Dendrobium thyrsiflorum]|uniref:Uncharacterized protein n=1 Tax=Dendrobium thyrsiflorum TaxID=117978 RepID=A0ABD0VCU4_DENTH
MDHNIPLRLRYFELHLTILTNRCSHLPNSIILFYQSKINGVRIPPNKSATVLLHRLRSAKATGESEVVFVSMDHICAGNGLSIEVCVHGEKVLKGVFQQGVTWGLESETIKLMMVPNFPKKKKLMMETKICVVTDQRFLTREKVGSIINRFYPKLTLIPPTAQKTTSILEDVDEDDDDDEDDDEDDEDVKESD